MVDLEPILKYEMTPEQARAYKLSLLWIELVRREFPNDWARNKLRKSGDPRKSQLFRHCLKLVQETKNLIKPEEYKLYITAQLKIFKRLQSEGVHALVEPNILTGERAWKRWLFWKRDYDKRMKQNIPDALEMNNIMSPALIIHQLENTKKFLEKEGVTTKGNIQLMIDSGTFKQWFKMEKISPYFLMLSPLVKEAVGRKDLKEVFDQDFSIYKISPEVEQWFQAH